MKKVEEKYPEELNNTKLEFAYVGLLLDNPKSIQKYYLSFEDAQFTDEMALNIYKSILFTEGGKFAPESIKRAFTYPKTSEEIYQLKQKLKREAQEKKYNIEKIFVMIKKLFLLKKYYINAPTKQIQQGVLGIKSFSRYKEMTIEELENIVSEVGIKRGISEGRLNKGVTDFLLAGESTLTSGISLPFKILTEVFKGIRLGETMAFSMPSNCGKSRFTINLAAHMAFVEKKKVLIISNEMSEEKMKLCLITTIINNPRLQKEIGCKIRVSEGELLEFKYRPDNPKAVKTDEKGYILKNDKETHEQTTNYGVKIRVQVGDKVKPGDMLNDGSIAPKELLAVTDPITVQNYVIQEVQKVYASQGVDISDKHIEMIARKMINRIRIVDKGDTDMLVGKVVSLHEFREGNNKVLLEGKKPATGRPILLGITKASLETDSFLSAASFQETTRVLTDAAIKGKLDELKGLKENVIIGKLIPAGTGVRRYTNAKFTLEKEYFDEEPLDTLEEELL